jgi:hypothetical protein
MTSNENAPGILADAQTVKEFVKTVIKSNQRYEAWNEENELLIAGGQLAPRKKVPVCIWGPHGIGKTQLLKSLAAELSAEEGRDPDERWLFTSIAPAQFEEMGDLLGMPAIDPGVLDDPSDDKTILVPPEWTPFKVEQARFQATGKHGPGIFLIDDANRADMRIISGLMQLLQDFELASWKMPENWHIVLTANPPGGDYIVRELDDAMLTRMLHIQMRYDEKVWARWAEQQGIDSRGISFVLAYPELLTGKRTTPRTLVQFFHAIESVADLTDPAGVELVMTLGKACLDAETVVEFLQFMQNDWSTIIEPEEILNAKKFAAIESRMQQLVDPDDEQGAKRVDIANIVVQRLVNRLLLMQTPLTEANRNNVVRFLKLEQIPLDLRVAAGRDLYSAVMAASADEAQTGCAAENRAMIMTIFEDGELARDILGKMG